MSIFYNLKNKIFIDFKATLLFITYFMIKKNLNIKFSKGTFILIIQKVLNMIPRH